MREKNSNLFLGGWLQASKQELEEGFLSQNK